MPMAVEYCERAWNETIEKGYYHGIKIWLSRYLEIGANRKFSHVISVVPEFTVMQGSLCTNTTHCPSEPGWT